MPWPGVCSCHHVRSLVGGWSKLTTTANNSTFSEPFPFFYFGKTKSGNYVIIPCNYVTLSIRWLVTFVDNLIISNHKNLQQ
jgi:hypothetical protein